MTDHNDLPTTAVKYTMTEDEYAELIKACQPVPYMIVGGMEPRAPQQNANDAWRALGKKRGFDWNTVTPCGSGQRDFMAVPIGDTDVCAGCGWHLDTDGHKPGCGNDTEATFDRIGQAIESIRPKGENSTFGPNFPPDADDTPVRDVPVDLIIRRDVYGDWRVMMASEHGETQANFGPRPGRMLAGLCDYLRECGGGDWTAFNRSTGRAI